MGCQEVWTVDGSAQLIPSLTPLYFIKLGTGCVAVSAMLIPAFLNE